ncbi:MAG TPA: class I SAM-dependent methyltransferase [Xanthobacteraceae bacterium]|nr:class I SAM-dependent methyltransferase [Xanthobacteraceae bacterium]
MTVIRDPMLGRLLADLHARSDAQRAEIAQFNAGGDRLPNPPTEDEIRKFRSDKFVALDRDKAEFCYQLCRLVTARRVVEIGTSFGVSTLYLAAAVRDNVTASGGEGVVIGTEYEADKAGAARANFAAAGLAACIELREGDLRETLKDLQGPIDFALVDIWIRMARPAIEMIHPYLRPGAVVVCDNTGIQRAEYAEYLAFIEDPANGFRTMTLPFDGGLEFSVFGG